ncbi:outer membrane protein assembly factor BamE [Marivivens aquimaris]|uniref:outer membrane protein assembly factor BamE n=1 Tax=Marivivens aquimaris TaxID=2774876 RepID=UPI00187DEFC3|nr:outer membrane protein assembly factor BamE [Marivivens aquimaris]
MGKTAGIIRGMRILPLAVAALLATSACVERIDYHGFTPSQEAIASVDVGSDTRATVIEKLGRPSMGGITGTDSLYYVSYAVRNYGPLPPKEVDRTVLALDFDAAGIVRNVELFGLEDGNVVSLSRRVTDDGLRDNTLMRQILGSIGRFNAADFIGSD